MGEVVFIDSGEMDKVPAAVREALNNESGSIPKVALSNSSGEKVYGTASHKALLGGVDKALKDAKRAMKADTSPAGAPPKPAAADSKESSSDSAPSTAEIKVTDKGGGTKEIAGAPLEDWVSSKGTKLNARLTKISGAKVTLVTDAKKTITVNQTDLSTESFQRLQEILSQ